MRMAAAVVQVIEVLARREHQRGQVIERILFVGQRAMWRSFFDDTAQQVIGKFYEQ